MEENSEKKVVVNTQRKDDTPAVYDDYSCSNILICKYPLHEVIRALFYKCFGFEISNERAAVDSCSTHPPPPPPPSSTAEPVPSSQGPTLTSGDMAMRFRPPPRPQPTRGNGPQTNSSGN